MLCATCAGLSVLLLFANDDDVVSYALSLPAHYLWHENAKTLCFRLSDNIAMLARTANEGCELCNIILTALPSIPIAQDEVARQLPLVLYVGGLSQINLGLDSEEEGLIELCALDISRDCSLACSNSTAVLPDIYEQVHPDPKSSHCTTLARHWFTTCTNDHQCTSGPAFDSDSVTRFLHIGPHTSNISLVEFAPNEAPSRWVALSYRWGDCQRLVLTRSNISKLKKDIHLQELDATIRDAIFIARALHLEYLWVDALCVFQDGIKRDWQAQSSKMQEVYEKSILTLVAVDTFSVRDQILVPRHDQYVSVPWDLYSLSDDRGSPNTVYLSKHWDPSRDRLAGPWSSRGWTLQEALLPCRLLYYTATQMVWKYCKETRYERGLVVNPAQQVADEFEEEGGRTFWAFDLFTKIKLIPWYMSTLVHDTRREKHRLWYELVEEYSGRHLTNSSDRSVAISGLAAKYNQLLATDRYVVGLWEADMIRGLMWHVKGAKLFGTSEFKTGPANTYRYPTWSWLGVASGHIVRNDHGSNIDCRDLARV